ncbi:MAG: GerMN domain-containing protein [Lachnospiraceae bacterium]|nr:GerMN domain-containing protein [Lachnospiraceae bacterium]
MSRNKRFFAMPLLMAMLAAVLLLTGGCGRNDKEQSSSYIIYYKNSTGTSLYEVAYIPAAETFDEMVTELMEQLATTPADATYVSALPSTVTYQGYERGIDALRIDFSGEYYDMSNTTEVLLRAAVVKTIIQIPGVTKVMITVDSEQLTDVNGELIAAMDAESFIDTKDGGINSYQTASLVLYFPNQDGSMLQKEVRSVDYSSNMVLERVVVEQLMAGSEYSDRKAVFSSGTEILDISTKNGICTLNFSAEFNTRPAENAPSAEAALYAIINSICETADDVNGVKFTIEGSGNVLFWDEIDLNSVFIMNQNIIETEALQTETEDGEAAEATDSAKDAETSDEDTGDTADAVSSDLAGVDSSDQAVDDDAASAETDDSEVAAAEDSSGNQVLAGAN